MLLNAGMGLRAVAERFGYTHDDWVFKLAAEHGYTGTKAQARAQRPRLSQRVTLWHARRNAHAS